MKAFPPLPASQTPSAALRAPGLLSNLKLPLLALSSTLIVGGLVVAFGGKLLPLRQTDEIEQTGEKSTGNKVTAAKASQATRANNSQKPAPTLTVQQPIEIAPPAKSVTANGEQQTTSSTASNPQSTVSQPPLAQPELTLDAAAALAQQLLANANEKDAEINRLRQALQTTQQQMNESLLMAQQRSQEYTAAVTQRQVAVQDITTRATDVARQADREFDDLEMENARLRGCVNQLESENASLAESNNRLRNEVSHLASSVNFLQVQVQVLNQEIRDLKEAAVKPPLGNGNPPPANQPPAQPQLPTGGPRSP